MNSLFIETEKDVVRREIQDEVIELQMTIDHDKWEVEQAEKRIAKNERRVQELEAILETLPTNEF